MTRYLICSIVLALSTEVCAQSNYPKRALDFAKSCFAAYSSNAVKNVTYELTPGKEHTNPADGVNYAGGVLATYQWYNEPSRQWRADEVLVYVVIHHNKIQRIEPRGGAGLRKLHGWKCDFSI